MYQVIARKYRPAQFSELISQEHVRTTLQNAINQRRIAHGYILSGQRGTGKTTVARIIARCLNCINGPTSEPCGVCSSCREISSSSSVDVIEIDAASNRGINEMRELRDNVRYRPARDRYKVFIIDEAHQITPEAFNALLKTLEEPPEWVVFILCTTESHKIPVTIASRCQQFSFRSVDFQELVSRMRWICEQEGIQADDEVLGVIAQAGEGSVRDSLSALDQAIACCGNTLGVPEIRELLGLFSLESLKEVAEALQTSDPKRMLEVVADLERNGRSLHHFARELSRYFRNLLVAKIAGGGTRLIGASPAEQARMAETASGFSEEDLTRYLNLLLETGKELQFSLQPKLHLEIGLLRLVHASRMVSVEQALESLATGKPVARQVATMRNEPKLAPAATPRSPVKAPAVETAKPPMETPAVSDLRDQLIRVLEEMDRPFVVDNLELASAVEQNGEVTITVPAESCTPLQFSQNDLQQALQRVCGKSMRVKVVPGSATAPSARTNGERKLPADENEVFQRAIADPAVQSFREAFPGAEIRQVRNLKEQETP